MDNGNDNYIVRNNLITELQLTSAVAFSSRFGKGNANQSVSVRGKFQCFTDASAVITDAKNPLSADQHIKSSVYISQTK